VVNHPQNEKYLFLFAGWSETDSRYMSDTIGLTVLASGDTDQSVQWELVGETGVPPELWHDLD
jgi:hypothetical protein